ncbi:MAG: DUF420 domain-containing protein [Alicyclobacillus sp.]|nr:DUF420 domain-containing protein [Alicyclobacillus sp.]
MAIAMPTFNIACIVASAICMAIGWRFIRQGRREAHRRMMLIGSVLAALFFIGYMTKTVLVGDTSFGGPAGWRAAYQTFLQIHSVLATVAGVLGIVTLVFAFRGVFRRHRKVGPWTLVIWFITAFSGVMVYLLLYVVFPPGPTTNMFHAWWG